MIVLVIWLPHSIAFGQTDHDDDASVGEWIVLAAFTAIGISFLVLLAIVWHRNNESAYGVAGKSETATRERSAARGAARLRPDIVYFRSSDVGQRDHVGALASCSGSIDSKKETVSGCSAVDLIEM